MQPYKYLYVTGSINGTIMATPDAESKLGTPRGPAQAKTGCCRATMRAHIFIRTHQRRPRRRLRLPRRARPYDTIINYLMPYGSKL